MRKQNRKYRIKYRAWEGALVRGRSRHLSYVHCFGEPTVSDSVPTGTKCRHEAGKTFWIGLWVLIYEPAVTGPPSGQGSLDRWERVDVRPGGLGAHKDIHERLYTWGKLG